MSQSPTTTVPPKHSIILQYGGATIQHHSYATIRFIDPTTATRSPSLASQLATIPRDAKYLSITEDVPTDEEWEQLGSHFSSIEWLSVDAGFDEGLNDREVPQHWPLKRLLVSSTCGEVTQNPHILLGRVRHLILMLTCGVRFEGPTSETFFREHREAVRRGEDEEDYVTDNGIRIVYGPTLYADWMRNKYNNRTLQAPGADIAATRNPDLNVDDGPVPDIIAMEKLEILENDAMETFMRFAMALPHLAYNLRTLNIRSTNMVDLVNGMHEIVFRQMLTSLDRLETLVFSIGEIFNLVDPESEILQRMWTVFPNGLKTLRFRGPISLTQDRTVWDEWVQAFANPNNLPKLEKLSFVCDLGYHEGRFILPDEHSDNDVETEDDRERSSTNGPARRRVSDEELNEAKAQCNRLLEAVRNRGSEKTVVVEPFVDEWHEEDVCFNQVDSRWYRTAGETVGADGLN